MGDQEDKYNSINFVKNNSENSTKIQKYKSQSHREFFENKFNQNTEKSVDNVIGETLDKVQDKLKNEIEDGHHTVSPAQKKLKTLNKKMMLDFAGREAQNSLGVIRGKDCSLLTKDDYKYKRKILAEKLKQLEEDPEMDDNTFANKLSGIEREIVGEPTKALVGKSEQPDNFNEKEHIEI